MPNQNQKLVDAETLDGKATTSQSIPFKNKQGDTMNLNSNKPKGNQKLTAKFLLYKKDYEKVFVLNGRDCQTLIALVEAKI